MRMEVRGEDERKVRMIEKSGRGAGREEAM